MNSLLSNLQRQINVLQKDNINKQGNIDSDTNDTDFNNKIEDLSKSVSKLQVESSTKNVETKKEFEKVMSKLEEIKKELKLMETTLSMKTEQFVNKMIKERIEQCKQDILAQVMLHITSNLPSTPAHSVSNENDEYEINVTLAGEDTIETSTPIQKKPRGRKPKAT
jgi:predicted transcriptional regulator